MAFRFGCFAFRFGLMKVFLVYPVRSCFYFFLSISSLLSFYFFLCFRPLICFPLLHFLCAFVLSGELYHLRSALEAEAMVCITTIEATGSSTFPCSKSVQIDRR